MSEHSDKKRKLDDREGSKDNILVTDVKHKDLVRAGEGDAVVYVHVQGNDEFLDSTYGVFIPSFIMHVELYELLELAHFYNGDVGLRHGEKDHDRCLAWALVKSMCTGDLDFGYDDDAFKKAKNELLSGADRTQLCGNWKGYVVKGPDVAEYSKHHIIVRTFILLDNYM